MNKILIIFIFIFNSSFSQEKGEIIYKLYFNVEIDENDDVYKKEVYQKINTFNGELKFSLLYDKEKSIFKNLSDNKIDRDDRLALIFARYFEYYRDRLDNKSYRYNEDSFIFFDKNQYAIFKEEITKWEITSEKKIIGGKECIKAIFYETAYHKKNQPLTKIEAWFCPEIPVNLGPLHYGGLPGLIFEINFNNVSYVVDVLNFTDKISSNFPEFDKSTIISEQDYYLLKNKISKEKKEEFEKQTQKTLKSNFDK